MLPICGAITYVVHIFTGIAEIYDLARVAAALFT